LWGIVFGANIVGTAIAALFMSSPVFTTPEITQCLLTVSHHIMAPDAMDNIMRGIPAGMLIAAIVWIMPMSRSFAFFTILTFTYFISIGNFAHVVVGSCEAAYDVLMGGSDLYDYFFRFLLPTGLGNIIGGTGVFTLLVSAQVRSENGKQLD
jgi:formate/nitrite transporter FocA (FNT family)